MAHTRRQLEAQLESSQLDSVLLDHASVDLDAAGSVTYLLRQTFRYDYDRPVRDLSHRLVVVPRATHGSLRRRLHRVEVSLPAAKVTVRCDGWGNPVVRVRAAIVPTSVEFTAASVVERVGPVTDDLLAAASLRDPRLLRPTRLTTADAALRDLAADLRREAADDRELAERACARVQSLIAYEYGVTSTSTTAAAALAGGRGVCQDHAHVMIALCREAGIPARYVSGHLLGDGGTHAWMEVVLPDPDGPGGARAVAFDPCNGCRAGARHVPVAVGRDYSDVAPTSGCYDGTATGRLTTSKRLGVTSAA